MTDTFYAEAKGPPRRKLYLYRSGIIGAPERGWSLVATEYDESGAARPYKDMWEEYFHEILRYIPDYAGEDVTWRREDINEVIDLTLLQPQFDGFSVPPA